MRTLYRSIVVAAALSLAAWAAMPASSQSAAPSPGKRLATKPDPRSELARRMPGSKPEDFRATPIPGLY